MARKNKIYYNPYLHTFDFGGWEDMAGVFNTTASILSSAAQQDAEDRKAKQERQMQAYESMQADRENANQYANEALKAKQIRLQESQQMANNTLQMQNNMFNPHKFFMGGMIGAAIQADSALGQVVGGDYKSGVGNALSKLPGLGLVGGLTNALFGMKTNEAELKRVNQDATALNNSVANTASATSLDDTSLNGPQAVNTNVKVYEGGLFSKGKAAKKNKELQDRLVASEQYAKRATTNASENIMENQMSNLEANYAAFGGELMTQGGTWNNGLVQINNGGTHEENPQQGVPAGVAPDGQPNLVEEGEAIYDNYVFSNRLKVPEDIRQQYHLKKNATFADAAKKASKESEERPNDPISKAGFTRAMENLILEHEKTKMKHENKQTKKKEQQYSQNNINDMTTPYQNIDTQYSTEAQADIPNDLNATPNLFASGGGINRVKSVPITYNLTDDIYSNLRNMRPPEKLEFSKVNNAEGTGKRNNNSLLPTWMRYAPLAGNAIGLGLSYIPADYSSAEKLEIAANKAGNYDKVSFKPIGNYLTYKPEDTDYLSNQLKASEQANARKLLNTSAGNQGTAMAGLLANSYNSQIAQGDALHKAYLNNRDEMRKVEEFNRGTNQMNSQGFLSAAQANQQAALSANNTRFNLLAQAAQMKQRIKDARDTSRSTNLTALFNNIGAVGKENMAYNMTNSNASLYYGIGRNGQIYFKPAAYDKEGNLKQDVLNSLAANGKQDAFGGILIRKR